MREYGLRGSFAQVPSSETAAPALILLFGYCTKIRLFKGLECLRLSLGNPVVKLVRKRCLSRFHCSDKWNLLVGGVAVRGFNPSKCDCQSGVRVVGHGSFLNTSSVLSSGRWAGKPPQTLWWTCHLTLCILPGEQNILAICSKPQSCISCTEETYQLFQLTERIHKKRLLWPYKNFMPWREYVLVCDTWAIIAYKCMATCLFL